MSRFLVFLAVALLNAGFVFASEDNINTLVDGLKAPRGLVADQAGNLYASEYNAHRVIKIDPEGKVSTFAGGNGNGNSGDGKLATAAQVGNPTGLAFDSKGNLYVAQRTGHVVRKIDVKSGKISTFFKQGLYDPYGLAFDKSDNLYIGDVFNKRVVIVSSSGSRKNIIKNISSPRGVVYDNNTEILYITDQKGHVINAWDGKDTKIIAGNPSKDGYSGDGGPAKNALLGSPYGIAQDAAGSLVYVDLSNQLVRKITKNGIISTLAGQARKPGFAGDGGPAKAAKFSFPSYIAVADGVIYISDEWNGRIRYIGVRPKPEDIKRPCSADDFLKSVKDATQGTVNLDKNCRYVIKDNDLKAIGIFYVFNSHSVLNGNGAIVERDPSAKTDFRLFNLSTKTGFKIENLTVRGGKAKTTGGGALYIDTNTELHNVTLSNNSAGSGAGGAILHLAGSLEISKSKINGNTAGEQGGAIYSQSINGMAISNSDISSNTGKNGGAVYVHKDATKRAKIKLSDVVLNHNDSGEGAGGAIMIGGGELDMKNATLIGNSNDSQGAAIYLGGSKANIVNSLIAKSRHRKSDTRTSSVYVDSAVDATISNSTITSINGMPKIAVESWGTLKLRNSLLTDHQTGVLQSIANVSGSAKKPNSSESYNVFANIETPIDTANDATITSNGTSKTVRSTGFKDATNDDYSLSKYSPAIDKGSSTGSPSADLAGNPRPYSPGTKVDVGAYEYQGKGEAALSLNKKFPQWRRKNVAERYYIRLGNDGVADASNINLTSEYQTSSFPRGVRALSNSFTNGANLHGKNKISWEIAKLEPDAAQCFSFELPGNLPLPSLPTIAKSTSDKTLLARTGGQEVPLQEKLLANLQFYPKVHGFKFSNYGGSSPSDLTDDDLIKIFTAEKACTNAADVKKTNAKCIVKDTLNTWRTTQLGTLNGGHCYGMASLSLDIFNQQTSKGAFDFKAYNEPNACVANDLEQKNLHKKISFYAALQNTCPVTLPTKDTKQNIPLDLDVLVKNLNDKKASDRYAFTITKSNGEGGHMVVPYAVEENTETTGFDRRIYVYENNRPDKINRYFLFNSTSGDWKYKTSTNTTEAESTYSGGKTNNNVRMSSLNWITTLPKQLPGDTCTFTTTVTNASASNFHVRLDGEGQILITRSDGKRIGYDPSAKQLLNEIDGAYSTPVILDFDHNVPSALNIPHVEGFSYDVKLFAHESVDQKSAALYVAAPDFASSIEGITLENSPAEWSLKAGFNVEENSVTLQSQHQTLQPSNISVAVDQADAQGISIDLVPSVISAGKSLSLGFNKQEQSVKLYSEVEDVSQHILKIKRSAKDGAADLYESPVTFYKTTSTRTIATDFDSWPRHAQPSIVSNDETQESAGSSSDAMSGVYPRPINAPDYYLLADGGSGVVVAPLPDESNRALLIRAIRLDDRTVKFETVNGQTLIADGDNLVVQNIGGNYIPEILFQFRPSLSGQGTSFGPIMLPGYFLFSDGERLTLRDAAGDQAIQEGASFLWKPE